MSIFLFLRSKTKMKFLEDSSNFYDQTKYLRQSGIFHFEEDPFSKNAQGPAIIMHETLFLLKNF